MDGVSRIARLPRPELVFWEEELAVKRNSAGGDLSHSFHRSEGGVRVGVSKRSPP